MITIKVEEVRKVACVGAGTIGSAWAAYFLSRGLEVVATDPALEAETRLRANIDEAWPKLERLGLSTDANREKLSFIKDVKQAVTQVDFIQESAPDEEALKIDLISKIDAYCRNDVVISSSSSYFLPSRLASACKYPERVIVGHPFVPAYLVPLVEVVGGSSTPVEILDWAVDFYRLIGKRPLKLKKEIEGYIANRFQNLIKLEALRLVEEGICDYADIDDAVTWGPGFRWPIQGPILHQHLGGGKGGVRHMIEHFGWEGVPGDEELFIDSVERQWKHVSIKELESWRDDNLLSILEVLTPPPKQ